MKSVQVVVAAALMLAFSSANAAGFEGFFGDGYHYSVKISKNSDGTYKMDYGDSMGAENIIECTATAKLKGDRLVLVTDRDCKEIEIDENENSKVIRKFTKSDKSEYVITEAGIDEYYEGNPDDVINFERIVE
jgi:hypothetical protein